MFINKKKLTTGIAISIAIFYLSVVIYRFYSGSPIEYINYLIAPLIVSFVFISSYYLHLKKAAYLMMLIIVGFYFITIPFYSPIDEGAHFDIILHIAHTASLPILSDNIDSSLLMQLTGNNVPGGLQYEAVHPPLYYLLGALLIFPFKSSIVISFFVLRMLGAIMLAFTLYIAFKIYSYFTKKSINKTNNIFVFLFMAFYMNPAFITRMLTISNESLVVVLFTLLFYFIIRFQHIQWSKRHIYILAILTALLILTKFTTIYVIGLIVISLFLYRQIKKIPIYLFVTGIISAPWFIYNYMQYGMLTGNKIHSDYVRKLVNPENQSMQFQYISQKVSYFLGSFWNPQESGYPNLLEPFNFITTMLSNFLLFAIIVNLFYIVYKYLKYKKVERLLIISLTAIVLNISVVIYGTWTQSIDILIGRYLYMNIIPLTIIMHSFLNIIVKTRHRENIAAFMLMLTLFLTVSQLFNYVQAPNNLIERGNLYSLLTHINSENYNEKRYQKYVEKKNLSIIPMYFDLSSTKAQRKSIIQLDPPSELSGLDNSNGSYKITGEDPHIVWALPSFKKSETEDFISLAIQYHGQSKLPNATGQLFWDDGSGFREEKSVFFDVSKSQVYNVPIGKNPEWLKSASIKAIRFDIDTPTGNTTFHLNDIVIMEIYK
ncbi:hypothetical protein [Paenibacillus wulumuqiensis]|uniref:hypothetical protein n=1 Tax=Paenibacillus wulumuqiensis TaxID=1567107 RepID=UPI0006196F41|nr:hypothetical protein [Paenibacillus wulumuqiensis]